MRIKLERFYRFGILMIFLLSIFSGCAKDYLVFTTSTKFGIDITQQAEQPPYVLLGYKRAELALIPTKKSNATEEIDAYSVLGNFCVKTDNALLPGEQSADSLQIRSVFATGMAAQAAAENKDMQTFFAKHVLGKGLRHRGGSDNRTNKDCF